MPRLAPFSWIATLATLLGCEAAHVPSGQDPSEAMDWPYDPVGGKADAFGRRLAGQAAPYDADPTLAEPERTAALRTDMRARREVAWQTLYKVLEPVPLLGLAGSAEEHDEIELPGGEVPLVPAFQTWYGADDLKRMFQDLYGGLGPAGRRVRAPFDAAAIDRAFEDNATALDRLRSWPLERYIRYVDELGQCPDGMSPEDCAAHIGRGVAGAVGGIGRIGYSHGTVEHILRQYPSLLGCLDRLDTLPVDADPVDDTNFTACFATEFPGDAVLIKAQWERADFERDLPVFDTDAAALARRLAPETSANWGEDGDRRADPGPDEIHTIRLRNGSVYRLAGLHVMTKELRHWQWITLWWSDRPDEDFGNDRPAAFREGLPAVWSNYKMCVATFYDEGDADPAARYADAPSLASALAALQSSNGAPTWCSNPYIEHGRGNASTNCIGCHQHGGATVAFDDDGDGRLDPIGLESLIDGDPRFPEHGRTRLRDVFPADYLWSFNRVDDFAHMIAAEVDHYDFEDGQAVKPRIAAILELPGDPARAASTFETRCTGCHGPDGSGGSIGPSLFDRVPARDDAMLLQTLLQGRGRMPAWAEVFDDPTLADLLALLRARFDTPVQSAP